MKFGTIAKAGASQWARRFSSGVSSIPEAAVYTVELRDWVQSSINGLPDMGPRSEVMQYVGKVNTLYHMGAPIKSLVGYGGTWWQLLAMHNINPFQHVQNIIDATPAKAGNAPLPIECLQRASHQFGLEEVSQDVVRETYRTLAQIAGKDRELIIRLFQFNNRDMQKDSTYAAIQELREQGVTNFVVSDEHSYAPFMTTEMVGNGIVAGLLRNIAMTPGDVSYPIQGGIKDFSGSLAPNDAEAILRYTHQRIQAEAERLEKEGRAVDADRLYNTTITLHNHLTDRAEHTAGTFARVGAELGRAVVVHAIHNVENATHPVMNTKAATQEQRLVHEGAEKLLATIVRKHKKQVVQDYVPGQPRVWTGFAGGGTPMIEQFIHGVSQFNKIPKDEARTVLYRHMEEVRDHNLIPPVTPAQKAIADLALLRIQNEQAGRPPYSGKLTSEAVDVVRNLHPETAKHKDLLEGAFRQYREEVLNSYEKLGAVTPELKAALFAVPMNAEKTSLDKAKTAEVFKAFAAKGEVVPEDIQEEILEACGPATRPTRFADLLASARHQVAELKEANKLKLPEEEAVLVIASLRGRAIGHSLAEHHGDKSKFPAIAPAQTQAPKPVVNVTKLWTENVAGDVMPEVNERREGAFAAKEKAERVRGALGR